MQVDPGHLFATLPLFDVHDSTESVVVELEHRADLVNSHDAIQGGLIATLIDIAGGRLALTSAPDGHAVTTADMTVHFVAPVRVGPARAIATPVRVGSRLIVVAVDVVDAGAGDRLSTRSTLTFAVLGPRTAT
ncbi:PaaI family thioesterase [uncultured Williamsia sp.]|uniref:PaaI family thioesterase n=1 Tax=uncultured Williamsia sp. TaxID=259311 RepID=UPI0026140967|nr:PaaI family thioesterase [uncultured Williamsia sp.]